jgi:RNA polymerase sigma-70 factor (ECF subfamily)
MSKTDDFEAARPQLLGLAYRLLGSISDAQDAVQDTYVKWITHAQGVDIPTAWLSRVCTNHCLDVLKSAHRKRVDYVGQWIPDQIQTEFEATGEDQVEMASSLTTAFLLLLERLTPKERAAYLLHDIFSMPFDEVAGILEMQPANCRKLATRARAYVVENNVRHVPEHKRQADLLKAFQIALETGDTNGLSAMLRADADLRADSGGKVIAVRDVLRGQVVVCEFIGNVLSHAWSGLNVTEQMINGTSGLLVGDTTQLHAAISFGYDANGHVQSVYIMRHPDKLAQFSGSTGLIHKSGNLTLH